VTKLAGEKACVEENPNQLLSGLFGISSFGVILSNRCV
jgi:hypothetical protein